MKGERGVQENIAIQLGRRLGCSLVLVVLAENTIVSRGSPSAKGKPVSS